MYRVLLALDDDESRAIAQAEAVADLPHADDDVEATLLHVFTGDTGGASVSQVASVRRAKEHLEAADVAVELAEESGHPADVVLEEAANLDADAIFVCGRKRTPAGKAVFGSVTQDVILGSDRPVMVVPPREE